MSMMQMGWNCQGEGRFVLALDTSAVLARSILLSMSGNRTFSRVLKRS